MSQDDKIEDVNNFPEQPHWETPEVKKHGWVRAEDYDTLQAQLDALPPAVDRWQPIETAPRDRDVLFWVVPKTPEEAFVDTSGNGISSQADPFLRLGRYGWWSSLSKATHWMPLPAAPGQATQPPVDPGDK